VLVNLQECSTCQVYYFQSWTTFALHNVRQLNAICSATHLPGHKLSIQVSGMFSTWPQSFITCIAMLCLCLPLGLRQLIVAVCWLNRSDWRHGHHLGILFRSDAAAIAFGWRQWKSQGCVPAIWSPFSGCHRHPFVSPHLDDLAPSGSKMGDSAKYRLRLRNAFFRAPIS